MSILTRNRRCLRWLCFLICALLPALAQKVEVAEDGHLTVRMPEVASYGQDGPPSLPYGAVPDWQNDLRRQVGGLQVADLNGDGRMDVAVGCYNSPSFPPYDDWHNLIYFNTGNALEAAPSWISNDQVSTGDIQVGLINNDAFPDIFAANGGGLAPSVIYFGTPTGVATAPGWSSNDNSWNNYAILFDLDHDGDTDVITANQGASQFDPFRPLYLFRNNNGVLETTPSWQSQEVSIQNFLAFGDLDGDGWEDLAVSKWVNFESGVYKNNQGDLETTPTWTTGDDSGDKGIAWADLDDNKSLDLALGHSPTRVYTNTGGALALTWFATAAFFGHSDLRWHDVDDDGDPDLAEIHFSNGHVNIYLNQNGVLDSAPSWSYDSSGAGTAIAFGDIDGDGLPDLVVGNAGDPSVMVFYNKLEPNKIFNDGFESGNLGQWSGNSATLPKRKSKHKKP